MKAVHFKQWAIKNISVKEMRFFVHVVSRSQAKEGKLHGQLLRGRAHIRHLIVHLEKEPNGCKFRERVELAVNSEKESNWLSIRRKSQIIYKF